MNNYKVSVLIPNYNYGEYLEECLNSVLNQTYKNIEVIFRDNASKDDSFEIAMKYYPIFKEKGIYFSIHENRINFGSGRNSVLCIEDASGDLLLFLSSDDFLEPTFVERCVEVFEKNENVSMVMTNRNEVDEHGNITSVVPFYNMDCIVEGEKQAGVFMMAGIAVPSQRMVRRMGYKMAGWNRIWNVAGDWYDNFLYSCCGDVAYITDPLCNYRVHTGNETNESELKLVGTFEHYQLLNAFVAISENFNMTIPRERYEEAIKKLGTMCFRYAKKMIILGHMDVAKKYIQLSVIYDSDLMESETYKCLDSIVSGEIRDKNEIHALIDDMTVMRVSSYDPPEGSMEINQFGEICRNVRPRSAKGSPFIS